MAKDVRDGRSERAARKGLAGAGNFHFLHMKTGEQCELPWAKEVSAFWRGAQGRESVTIPGSVLKTWACGTEGHG